MEAGKYTMRLLDYGVSQSSGGFPQIFAQFTKDGQSITWYGGTKEVVNEGKKNSQWDITLKNLQTMGYEGDPSALGACAKLYEGPMDCALKVEDYDVVLANESYTDGAGVKQTKLKVQYINKVGEGGGVGKKFDSKDEMMKAFSNASKAPKAAGKEEYFK